MNKKTIIAGLVAGGAIFVLTIGTFAVNIRNAFVAFDDYEYIVKNTAIAQGLTPRCIYWAIRPTGYASNWHPLAWMSHAFDNTLADGIGLKWREVENDLNIVVDTGKTSFSRMVHGENVLFHAVNAYLLWALMMVMFFTKERRQTFGSLSIIFTSSAFALLWALHPLRVEVVAWASERKELLSVFFMLLTLIVYIWNEQYGRVAERAEIPDDPDRALLVKALRFVAQKAQSIVSVFYICALLAKPVAVSLPAVIFAYDWLICRRKFSDSLSRIVPFAVFALISCYLTMKSQHVALVMGSNVDAFTHLRCVVEAPAVYLLQTLWPSGLSLDYPFPNNGTWPVFAIGCLLLAALVTLGVVTIWRHVKCSNDQSATCAMQLLPFAGFSAIWMYVGLLPMIGIVRVGFEPHSDRYTYWIGCGAAVFAAGLVMRFIPKVKRFKFIATCASVALLSVLAFLSVRQSLIWRNTETLFADAVEKYHGERFAQGLGEILAQRGGENVDRAEKILREVLTIRGTPRSQATLAMHLASYRANDPMSIKEARQLARNAIREDPSCELAYAALGFADRHEGIVQGAFENMKKAYDLGYRMHGPDVDLQKWARASTPIQN